jgi:hypothetical protein
MECMPWSARSSIAIVLTLALAAVPVMLDQCTAFCELARPAASPSEPTCHHASDSTARIGDQPTRCGHDHEATVSALIDSAAPISRAVASVVAAIPVQTASVATGISRVIVSASPPRERLSRRLSVSLRI